MNYYERHLGDYSKDTAHLTMIEHGAYGLLLDRYYGTEAGIPADQVHRIARARTKEEKAAVDVVLAEFFQLVDGLWINKRAEEEIIKAQVKIIAAKENGKKGGRPKKTVTGSENETQQKPTGLFVGSENETQQKAHQAPSTRHQTPDIKPIASSSDLTTGSSGEELSAAVRFAVAIRGWEKARGKMAAIQAQDPRLQAWADAGVTDDQLALAYEWAVDDRTTKGDTAAINAGFLDVFVAKVMKPVTCPSAVGKLPPPKAWFMTSPGIEAKAAELGIAQLSGEQFYQFKDRVFASAGVTEEQVRKARIDAGERV